MIEADELRTLAMIDRHQRSIDRRTVIVGECYCWMCDTITDLTELDVGNGYTDHPAPACCETTDEDNWHPLNDLSDAMWVLENVAAKITGKEVVV